MNNRSRCRTSLTKTNIPSCRIWLLLAAAGFAATAQQPAVTSPLVLSNAYVTVSLCPDRPGIEALSVDSLGKEHFPPITMRPPSGSCRPAEATRHGSRVEYRSPGHAAATAPLWKIELGRKELRLESHWSAEDPPDPLVLDVDNSHCHVTLLGHMNPDSSMCLPAIMHLPDQGTFRISVSPKVIPALGYGAGPGDMLANQAKSIKITFPPATAEHPRITYRWEVVAIHPDIGRRQFGAAYDGFRRNWLNILQYSPYWRTLANHTASDTCAFCYYEYGDIAERTPPLAKGLTALDPVRQTLDRIIGGANAYGMPGHGAFPEYSTDTLPSLLIAASDYVTSGKDQPWLQANYAHLARWADIMLATDRDGNGLIKYTLSGNSGSWPETLKYRPANWWDTIGFGHEDAYANALAYRALNGMSELARQAGHPEAQQRYHAAAEKLRAAYFPAFYNPATGVLAGWRSADGQLHDYYFLWVNGIAIHYGLVPADKANAIMDRLLAKMREVGYARFDLGLPGNLVSVARKDYVDRNPRFGGGKLEDGSDAFQRYENGGATACFAYFTLAALYDLGRIEDGDRILFPMLQSFAKGDFQGRCGDGLSKDWRAWDGACWGYEGFLVDNYYALLAVLDREAALKRGPHVARNEFN